MQRTGFAGWAGLRDQLRPLVEPMVERVMAADREMWKRLAVEEGR
ncbi:MAG: hypothetical protein ACLQK4_12775 [Acidimicrobiales bacterium]|jgi:hypothetical protein